MKNREFDRMIRARASAEEIKLSPLAQEHFQEGMDNARIHQARQNLQKPRKKSRIAWILSAECIVAAVLVFLFLPARDVTDQGLLPQESRQAISATMVPITQPLSARAPEVRFDAVAEKDGTKLYGSLANRTDDIWLVEWSAQMEEDQAEANGLIWLEPGVECSECLVQLEAQREINLSVEYRGYRVAAKMLHWMDGDPLHPGEEGYEDQQSLMMDAFAAQALILAPGGWENGQAGAMNLPMPESWHAENPDGSAVAYYLKQGMLEDGSALCGGTERMELVQ